MIKAVREAFGKSLVEVGKENKDVVVLDADLATSSKVDYFAKEFPSRYFQMGVAEQNMMGVAAGLSLMGKIPFVSTFGVFASKRACDQVSISIAYPKLNVKIVGAYSGILSGNNGATHQSIEDTAIMRAMPNMVVIDAADDIEMAMVVREIIRYEGPVYLRVTRDAWPRISPPGYKFKIGKAVIIREGKDVALIGSGVMSSQCMEAAKILEKDNIEAEVINISTIKPINEEAIIRAAKKTKALVTAENHNIIGGLGSAVAEVLAENTPTHLIRIGIKDIFGECGSYEELLNKYEMSPGHIAEAAKRIIERKLKT